MRATNRDDLGEYRPGLRAVRELGVRSPLAEAGFIRAEILSLSQPLELAPRVVDRLKESDYTYIILDLEGHLTDSMGEILKDRRSS